jgi:hypothetical protein
MPHKILIIYPYENLSTNPSVSSIVASLIREGAEVDLIYPEESGNYPPLPSEFSHSRSLDLDSDVWSNWKRPLPIRSRIKKSLANLIRKKRKTAAQFARSDLRHYSTVIAIDPAGLVTASRLTECHDVNLGYVSFELLMPSEATSQSELLLEKETRKGLARCNFAVIQDEERLESLRECGLNSSAQVAFLPVAPRDNSSRAPLNLREIYKIPTDHKIILFQGTIAHWSGLHEWEPMLKSLTGIATLLVHSRHKVDRRTQKYLAMLANYENFRFSDTPHDEHELPRLTSAADFGLVSYHPDPSSWYTLGNLLNLGLASGKFSYFMMCGVPVLCNKKTNLSSIVQSKKVGLVYDSTSELQEYIQQDENMLKTMRSNARTFYLTSLNPENFMPIILKLILQDQYNEPTIAH